MSEILLESEVEVVVVGSAGVDLVAYAPQLPLPGVRIDVAFLISEYTLS